MFGLCIRQAYSCNKIIIRTIRNRKLQITNSNPGLSRRIKAFKEEAVQFPHDEAEEFFEQSETDFSYAGEAYNEHLNETLIGKYKLSHQIVKDKYFKENMPNLLTWSEKEQIRHLANTEPEEWTPEKLAESFPVTVHVVKKLLKYPWKPATEERITRHDASVMRNWKELKEGTLTISEDLRKHFLKFSGRTIPPLNKKSIKVDITQQEKMGEFEKIVRRCAAKENSQQTCNEKDSHTQKNSTVSSNTTRKQHKDHRRITLDELSEKIKKRLEKGRNVDMPDKMIVDAVTVNSETQMHNFNTEIDLFTNDDNKSEVAEYKKGGKDDSLDVMNYPERIRIPKKAYSRGATYKVNDCYYDHDGRFLYRVLGMTK